MWHACYNVFCAHALQILLMNVWIFFLYFSIFLSYELWTSESIGSRVWWSAHLQAKKGDAKQATSSKSPYEITHSVPAFLCVSSKCLQILYDRHFGCSEKFNYSSCIVSYYPIGKGRGLYLALGSNISKSPSHSNKMEWMILISNSIQYIVSFIGNEVCIFAKDHLFDVWWDHMDIKMYDEITWTLKKFRSCWNENRVCFRNICYFIFAVRLQSFSVGE